MQIKGSKCIVARDVVVLNERQYFPGSDHFSHTESDIYTKDLVRRESDFE